MSMPEAGQQEAATSAHAEAAEAAIGTQRPRGRRLAWAWAWRPGLFALAVAALFPCYLHVSRTQRLESDGASIAVQAWDMLHGNLLLHGWTLTDVAFYSTELPEYMIVEAIRGLNADALHVAAALTYALLVPLAAVLAKGRATGREAVVRMLIAAGIMIAPEPGPGVFILLFQPDHIGTQVPMLATWLVLDRAPRRWWVPVVIGVMLAWIGVADQIVGFIGVAPLVVVCGVRAVPRLVRGHEPLRSVWFELSLAAAAIMSIPAAKLATIVIHALGGYTVLPLSTGVTSPGALPLHLRLGADGVLGLYGGYAAVWPFGVSYLFAVLHLVGVALALWGLWLVFRRFFRCDDMIAQVLAVGIVINIALFLLSVKPTAYWGVRELAGVLPAGAVIAGRMVGPVLADGLGRRLRAAVTTTLAVVLAGYLAALGYAVTRPAVPAFSQDLADWLLAHHVQYGLTSYGLSGYEEGNTTTQSGGGVVGLRPVIGAHGKLSPGPHEFNIGWYDPRHNNIDFVVLHDVPTEYDPITATQARATFGPPARVYHFKQFVIMAWDKNLLPELGPAAPD